MNLIIIKKLLALYTNILRMKIENVSSKCVVKFFIILDSLMLVNINNNIIVVNFI